MKSPKSKLELIEAVMQQIKVDVDCWDIESLEEMLMFMPAVNLIEYLPEEDWKQFKHLRDDTTIA